MTADGLCGEYTIRHENLAEDLSEVRVGVLPRLMGGMRREGHHYSECFYEHCDGFDTL